MALPTQCPNCRAPLPESLERFGTNCACKVCGQILRGYDAFPVEDIGPSPVRRDLEEDSWDESTELPPTDQLLTEGWGIFRGQMWLCVGVTFLVTTLNLLAQSPELVWQFYLSPKVGDPVMRNYISLGINLYSLFRIAFGVWINIGQTMFMLKIARGQHAEVGDLFRGGHYFWRAILCSITLGLAVFAGTLLCIIPGMIVAMMYGQFLFVLVDQNLPGLDSLGKSSELTNGKKWALFGLFFVCAFINLFGVLALFIGMFFTAPFTSIVFALAYDRICGRTRRRDPIEQDDEDDEDE